MSSDTNVFPSRFLLVSYVQSIGLLQKWVDHHCLQWFPSFFASIQGVFLFLKSMVKINTTVWCRLQGSSPHLGRFIFLFQSLVSVRKNWCRILPRGCTSLQRHRKPQPPGKWPSSFPNIKLQVYIYYVVCPTWILTFSSHYIRLIFLKFPVHCGKTSWIRF